MSDEKPVPETLETIAAGIRALRQSMDSRFGAVDTRFDEVKAQLGTKIEAVHAEVKLVYDEVIAQRAKHKANADEHDRFREQLEDHDTRLLALTRRKSGRGK